MATKKRVGKSRRQDVAPPLPNDSIFDDLVPEVVAVEPESVFEDAPMLAPAPPAEIIAVERDLTPDQRAEFTKLLDTKMTLEERADQLVELARFTDTKRAPVGLRAIMEINRLTGLSVDKPTEAPAMFALPPGTNVSVTVEKVEK